MHRIDFSLSPPLSSNLQSNRLSICSNGSVSGAATCSVSCVNASSPVFSGPCGNSTILSPSLISNCTNGKGYLTVIEPFTVPGGWTVMEEVFLTVNAPLVFQGSVFLQQSANISLSAPLVVRGDLAVFPLSNLSVNVNSTQPVTYWITVDGACFTSVCF